MLRGAFIPMEQKYLIPEISMLKWGIKALKVPVYEGTQDVVKFENWLMQVLGWFKLVNLILDSKDKNLARVHMLSQMLGRKALSYYRQHVSEHSYTNMWDFSMAILKLRDCFLHKTAAMTTFQHYESMTQGP